MVVHQGFFSFFNCSLRFLLKVTICQALLKIKHGAQHMFVLRSSSILHLAFQSAIRSLLSFEVVLCHSCQFLSCFMIHKLSGMRYLNPSFSSLDLSWVRFHLKPILRMVSIVVLINDPIFSFLSR